MKKKILITVLTTMVLFTGCKLNNSNEASDGNKEQYIEETKKSVSDAEKISDSKNNSYASAALNNNTEIKLEDVKFEPFWAGFTPVLETECNNYSMDNYCILTNEEQWNEWKDKYAFGCQEVLTDSDWENIVF